MFWLACEPEPAVIGYCGLLESSGRFALLQIDNTILEFKPRLKN